MAVAAPATIWGIFKNSIESGLRFFVFGGLAAAAYKFNKDKGHVFAPEDTIFSGVTLEMFCLIIHVQYVSFISDVYIKAKCSNLSSGNRIQSSVKYVRSYDESCLR